MREDTLLLKKNPIFSKEGNKSLNLNLVFYINNRKLKWERRRFIAKEESPSLAKRGKGRFGSID